MELKVLFLCFLALAYVKADDDIDMDALERELEESDFIEIDGSQLIVGGHPAQRGITDKVKQFCSFSSHKAVGCCAQMKMPGWGDFKVPACVNISVNTEEKFVDVEVTAIQNKLVEHKFPMDKVERICDRLPGKLDMIKFCLYTSTTESDENGLVSCSSLDVLFKKTTVAIINFSCINYKDGQLTFDKYQDTERESMFTVKFKNPIKTIINLAKKLLQKKE